MNEMFVWNRNGIIPCNLLFFLSCKYICVYTFLRRFFGIEITAIILPFHTRSHSLMTNEILYVCFTLQFVNAKCIKRVVSSPSKNFKQLSICVYCHVCVSSSSSSCCHFLLLFILVLFAFVFFLAFQII